MAKNKSNGSSRGGRRAGAGRPKDYGQDSVVNFSVSMPLSVAKWCTDQAEAQGISRAKLISACVLYFRDKGKIPPLGHLE